MKVLSSAEAVHGKLKLASGKWGLTFRSEPGQPDPARVGRGFDLVRSTEWLPHYATRSRSNDSISDFATGVYRESNTA